MNRPATRWSDKYGTREFDPRDWTVRVVPHPPRTAEDAALHDLESRVVDIGPRTRTDPKRA